MKKLVISLAAILWIQTGFSQVYQWGHNISTSGQIEINSIAVDGNEDVYYVGRFGGTIDFDPGATTENLTAGGTRDGFIQKVDKDGNYLWTKQFVGTSGNMILHNIEINSVGNLVVYGQAIGGFDLDPGAGTATISNAATANIVVVLDSDGDFISGKEISGDQSVFAGGMDLDATDNIIITGTYSGTADFDTGAGTQNETAASGFEPFIVKLDDDGDYVDHNVFTSSSSSDSFYDIAIDGSGSLWVWGMMTGDIEFVPGTTLSSSGTTNFLVKLNSSLVPSEAFNWATVGSIGALAIDQTSTTGNIYLTSFFSGTVDFDPGAGTSNLTSLGSNDAFVLAFDNSGDFLWVNRYGTAGSSEIPYAIDVDGNGDIHLGYENALGYYSFIDADDQTSNLSYSFGGEIRAITADGNTLNLGGAITSTTANLDLCSGSQSLSRGIFGTNYVLEQSADVPTIGATETTVCSNGASITLSVADGSLNDATDWEWYSGSCDGISVGTGTSIMVSPSSTTTYYVRGEGYTCLEAGNCASVTITVNSSPTDIILSSASILENQAVGTTVGIFSSTDATSGDSHAYALIAGAGDDDNSLFTIAGSKLQSNAVFDFEDTDTYSILVQSEDGTGCTYDEAFTITIDDESPEAPSDIQLSNSTLDENEAINTVVGILTSTDDDAGETFTYSLVSGSGSTDNGSFNINDDELRISEPLDYEAQETYSIRIRSDDGNSGIFEKEFTITATNVIETDNDILSFSIPGQLSSTDIDNVLRRVTLTMDIGVDFTNLVPSFEMSSGATSITISGTPQSFVFDGSSGYYFKSIFVTSESGVSAVWSIRLATSFPAGTYTVGSAGDFGSLRHFFNFLENGGIEGDVVVEIQENLSEEPFILDRYPGTETHSLTIKPAASAGDITIQGSSSSTYFQIKGVENVTIDGQDKLTFENLSTGWAISMSASGSDHNQNVTIRNCKLLSSEGGISIGSGSDIVIENNTFQSTPTTTENTASGISFGNAITSVSNITIRNNFISFGSGFNSSSGSIFGISRSTPIGGTFTIANNIIEFAPSSAASQWGIHIPLASGADDIIIAYNTIVSKGTNTATSTDIYGIVGPGDGNGPSSSLIISNNIVDLRSTINSGTQTGMTFYENSPTSLNTSGNNLTLDGAGGTESYAIIDGTTYDNANFSTLEALISGTTNSSVTYEDITNSDYHLDGSSVTDPDLRGQPVSGITADSEGTSRSVTAPTKGAYELTNSLEPITWNGSVWDNGTGPESGGISNVVIDGAYLFGTNGSFDAHNLTVNSSLVVDNNGTLTVNGDLTINGGMRISSGASLITFDGNVFSGFNVDVRRNTRYADGRYSFVGTPVQQNSSLTGSDLGDHVYKYNETTPYGSDDGLSRWENASSDELIPGKGYTQANKGEIPFIGIPNTGTITFSGTYTEDTDDANEGWNLVANPYTAAISVSSFLSANSNTSGSVYIWDDNGSDTERGTNADYIVANAFMASATAAGGQSRYNFHLGSAQGFFVQLNDAMDTDITFTEDMRVSGSNADDNFFRKEPLPIVRINLLNAQGLFKQAVLGFTEDAAARELNPIYDARAFNAGEENGIFTLKAGRALALSALPRFWESVQLQVNISEAGSYTLELELEDYERALFLRDNQTGEVVDLRYEGYTFTSNAGIHTDRFVLIASNDRVLGVAKPDVLIYAHNDVLHIHQEGAETRSYQVFNLQGQQVLSKEVQALAEVDVSGLARGVYLVFDGSKTHKVILK